MGTITRHYDSFGRSSGLAVGANYQVGYGYSGDGRFASVTSSVQSVSSVVNYSYLPGTDILSGWSNSAGFAVTRAFEAHRDLLIAVSNRYNGGTVSAFDYINDALARRTQRIDSGSATATNAFGYNPRSELASARMGTNAYGYTYDPIGNRTAATNNAEALTYAANALNQYTNITAGTVQVPQYDLDGNMTAYGDWTFAWSGENRLILASNTAHRVEYTYDYQGRMIQKVVDGQTNSLIWDGFTIIQMLTHSQTHTLTNAFVWGLDLSSTLQGAGGVGGLLAVTRNGTTYDPCYDSNGNITDYVATNGAVAAHYEYSPFGEIVVQSGDMADAYTHRFSTKPWCAVTGLSEYELRKYSPSMGRWVSRDPIGEIGGKHIYVLADNRMMNAIDLLGLKITYGKRDKSKTKLEVVCDDCESVSSLAKHFGFEADVNNKWLEVTDSIPLPARNDMRFTEKKRTFKVPNVISFTYGSMTAPLGTRGIMDFLKARRDVAKIHYENLGFYIREGTYRSEPYDIEPENMEGAEIVRALQADDIHGWVFFGHGKGGSIAVSFFNGLPPGGELMKADQFKPLYKLPEVVLFACEAGMGSWKQHVVSANGLLYATTKVIYPPVFRKSRSPFYWPLDRIPEKK
jgi:RHS repeat-associated protein